MQEITLFTTEPAAATNAPEWFILSQQEAWKTFLDTPLPTAKEENWRFGNRKQLNFENFKPAVSQLHVEDLEFTLKSQEEVAAQYIFANNELIHASNTLPKGVICLPLGDALQQHSQLVQQYFSKDEAKLGSKKFAALHLANTATGVFVYVPKGVQVETNIEITYTVTENQTAIFPHTIVVTEDNASVTVIDKFESAQENEGLVLAMNSLHAKPGSNLKYIAIQTLNEQSKLISTSEIQCQRDANIKSFTLNTGAKWVRNESHSRLLEAGAHADMLSINIAANSQEFDQRTFQSHEAPHTTSDLLYKNTSYNKAKTVFSGLISVDEGAHFTDAYQTCRNLLMDDTTEANSMPGLQINADNVKCSHGSTASAISDEEIFYLQARGVHSSSAKQLIARGFSIEVIEKIQDATLEKYILELIDEKFSHLK